MGNRGKNENVDNFFSNREQNKKSKRQEQKTVGWLFKRKSSAKKEKEPPLVHDRGIMASEALERKIVAYRALKIDQG